MAAASPSRWPRGRPQECRFGIGWNATSHQPTRSFRIAPKIATIRFKFKVHSGDPGLRERSTHMGRLLSRWSWGLLMVLAGCGLSWPAIAQDLFDLPVGTVQNFGPNLQTTGGGRCRQPEGLAIDPDGNLYAASNSDQAITVGYVCVINNKGELVDTIAVPAGPGAGAVGLLGELWEDGYLIVLDQADDIQPHGRILRINPRTHEVKTIATGLAFPNGMAEDRHGNIYVTDSLLGSIYRF